MVHGAYNDIGRAHSQTHVLSGAGGYESRSFEALSPIIKAYRPIMTATSQSIPGVGGGTTANNNPWRSAQQQRARESPAIKEVLYPSHRAASDFFLPRHVTSRSVQVLPPACNNTRRVYTRSYTTPAPGVHQQPPGCNKPPRRVTFDLPPTTPRGGASNGNDDELFASYQNSQAAGMTSVCEVAGVASWLRSRRQANNKESFRIKTVNNNHINSLSRRYSASSSGVVVLPSSVQQSAVVYQQQQNRRGVTSAFAAIDSSSYKLPPTVGPAAGNGTAVGPAAVQACSPAAVALLRACREGDEDILNDLIASRVPHVHLQAADVNCVDVSGRTPASYVAASGSLSMLEALARFPSIDFNRADNEGNTPLHFAAQAGHVEVLNLLLSRCAGVEVDSRNNLGFTPLMKAALQGRTKCAKLLLFAGASPSMRDLGRGFRAEQWARYCGRHVCAEVIDKFSRHRLLERAAAAHSNSGRWGSEPELSQSPPAPIPQQQPAQHHSGGGSWLRSKLRRAFRSNADAPSSKSRHEYSSSCPSSHSGTPPPQTPRVFIVPKVQVTPAPVNSPTAADTTAETAAQDSSKPTPNSRRKK